MSESDGENPFSVLSELSQQRLVWLARKLATEVESLERTKDRLQTNEISSLGTLAWGKKYLPEHFSRAPSGMHQWLGSQLDRCDGHRGELINLIGPRGAAKSTIGTLCYVLRAALESRELYIWIVSDTKQQAHTHLENVKNEILSNPRILDEYPESAAKGGHWRATSIELRNGVVIESFGTGQRIRGRRRQANRPTLIVCDDLQNDGHIASADQRDVSRRWFHGTLMKAGTRRTNIVNLATALHRDALALELHRTPGWTSALFKAIEVWPTNMDLWRQWEDIYSNADDRQAAAKARKFYEQNRSAMEEGAQVLWPAEEDLYTLMQMRVQSGRTTFDREKQGSPVDPELCEWPDDYFDSHIWFSDWPSELTIKTIALDPSKGNDSRQSDYSAYVLLGVDRAGTVFIEADLAKRPTPQLVADGVALCEQFRPHVFGVEANQYQELLAGEFVAEFQRQKFGQVVPWAIHNQVNKQVRIRRLGPYLSQRRFRFLASSASTRLLVDQLRDFPVAAHDDGPDALEMALRLAEELWRGHKTNDGLGDRLPIG